MRTGRASPNESFKTRRTADDRHSSSYGWTTRPVPSANPSNRLPDSWLTASERPALPSTSGAVLLRATVAAESIATGGDGTVGPPPSSATSQYRTTASRIPALWPTPTAATPATAAVDVAAGSTPAAAWTAAPTTQRAAPPR